MDFDDKVKAELARIEKGGAPKYHQKNAESGKLCGRERVKLLLAADSLIEDGAFANAKDPELPADGVITGLGRIGGRVVAAMANDSTVKAGSWGRRTVEKIIRIQEQALKTRCPMLYLVDSAGARITDQIEMFPGRRGAGRIFYMQCQMSGLVPPDQNKFFDMFALIRELIDADSLFELKKLFAPEVITAFARIEGKPVGIVASQPKHKGGVLFVDSADKAARFIWLCDAFGIPILYLADVPGFMIGTKVEREGIIRHGAKMIMAVSEATVPKLCVIVRKAYGAGLYAFGGPAFEPDATIALPQAMIAVMGPEAAVNAVYFNKIQEKPEGERAAYVQQLRDEYKADIDIYKLAAEQVVDAIVPGDRLREEIVKRFDAAAQRERPLSPKRRSVTPV